MTESVTLRALTELKAADDAYERTVDAARANATTQREQLTQEYDRAHTEVSLLDRARRTIAYHENQFRRHSLSVPSIIPSSPTRQRMEATFQDHLVEALQRLDFYDDQLTRAWHDYDFIIERARRHRDLTLLLVLVLIGAVLIAAISIAPLITIGP